ncbi:uncharacterized protein LOC103024639 [Astyanax mexicanus]|uniref:uncharacterized protein LOC103024639 n=1 Tax=Astyanax mexicanus TaxID=7994 RepID=UPI0020CAAEE0|nr:uncharacterized protein LOC103024639 [Astyanax mexicanus]
MLLTCVSHPFLGSSAWRDFRDCELSSETRDSPFRTSQRRQPEEDFPPRKGKIHGAGSTPELLMLVDDHFLLRDDQYGSSAWMDCGFSSRMRDSPFITSQRRQPEEVISPRKGIIHDAESTPELLMQDNQYGSSAWRDFRDCRFSSEMREPFRTIQRRQPEEVISPRKGIIHDAESTPELLMQAPIPCQADPYGFCAQVDYGYWGSYPLRGCTPCGVSHRSPPIQCQEDQYGFNAQVDYGDWGLYPLRRCTPFWTSQRRRPEERQPEENTWH